MNCITPNDFGLFKTEEFSIDFLSFNISQINSQQIIRLASYFQSFGFNAYQKQSELKQFRQDINHNNRSENAFEVYFILKIPYQTEIIQLQFPGVSGKKFYQLIKERTIQWEKLPNPVFSRLDLVYQRFSKFNDPISTIDFINSCYMEFQELHSSKNLVSERNQKGFVLKIGNRRSSKYYRIYTNQKNNLLRFEAEMKNDLIKDFQDLLIASSFDEYEFESKIAYQFFKYSFQLFEYLYPFLFSDFFHQKLMKHQFQILFEIIKTYSSTDIRKEFNIQRFIEKYPVSLNNKQKKQIKELFIHYLKTLHQEGKLQDKVLDLSSNKILHISDLNSSHLQLAVFENLKIKFL